MGSYHDANGRFRQTEQQLIRIPLACLFLAAGTPLAAFADGASVTPGLAVNDSEAVGVRWNNHATPAAVFGSVVMPSDRKPGTDVLLKVRAAKSGATVGDAVTFTVACFNNVVGALHDADANFGGATGAMVGNAAAKTVAEVQRALASADIADGSVMSFSVKPTDGTLGTDDVTIYGLFLEYERIVTPT